jgi:hypothetical protein
LVSRLWRVVVVGALGVSACGGGGATAKPAETAGESPSPTASSGECADNGLYSVPPPTPGSDGKNHEAVAPALAAFSDAESSFEHGDKAGATKKFLAAAHELSRVPTSHEQGDWARYARELAYHNALWAAAAAGVLEKTKAELEKASREDSVLADKIRAMLGETPAQCSKP